MKETQPMKAKRKRLLLPVLALLIVIGAGLGGWQVYTTQAAANATATTTSSPYQTSPVRQGNLSVTVSGSGKVITSHAAELGFSVPGTVSEIKVQLGETVTKGQVLAVLDGLDDLNLKIQDQELALQKAQQALDDLQASGQLNLAQAQADLAGAQQTYATAKANEHFTGDGRCLASKTEDYYFQYLAAQKQVEVWEGYLNDGNTGYGRDYILERLNPLRKQRDAALANMNYCQSYTDQEIQDSQAAVQLAKAKMDLAGQTYQGLKATSGIDPVDLQVAQAALKNAQLQLTAARDNLAGATITATMDGVVSAINGAVGDTAGTGTFITISDLSQPQVQMYIDETDLINIEVGCAAQVTFDSLSGQAFPGTVTQVSSSLAPVQSVSMMEALVDLEKKATSSGKPLPLGMTASVEVTCKQANNVLVIPSQAVYKSASQPAYVYVLNDQGQPEKRTVEIGIQTAATTEIKSGLSAGERVITSSVKSQ